MIKELLLLLLLILRDWKVWLAAAVPDSHIWRAIEK
jgi:hypothetical protein